MSPVLRNILAIVTGIVVGSVVNMGIVMISGFLIPPPLGVDNTTLAGLKSSMHLFEPKHFIFPFLAHAIGTLVGAFLAARLSSNGTRSALIVGGFFLLGGIANVMMLPSPIWFSITDLLCAYLPMAYLGGKAGMRSPSA